MLCNNVHLKCKFTVILQDMFTLSTSTK